MRLAVVPVGDEGQGFWRQATREIYGKPIFAWSIAVALSSPCIDRVVVSTSDRKIADLAVKYGAEAPFLRPAEVTDDQIPPRSIVEHAIKNLYDDPNSIDAVCCLHPTAPLMSAEDIKAGYERLVQGNCTYAFAVTSFPVPLQRALRIGKDGHLAMYQPVHFGTDTQVPDEVWYDARHFYWARAEEWCKERPVIGPDAVGVPVPRERVQFLSTPEDWHLTEMRVRAAKQGT